MYPPTLLARVGPDSFDPTLPPPSIQPPSYSSWSLTTCFDPPRFPFRPPQETALLTPGSLRASDPTDLVDRDPSLLPCGARFTSLGFRSPTARVPVPVSSGKPVEIPQAAIPTGWVVATLAHPEIISPFPPFLVLFTDDAPRPSHHVLSHTLDWLACRPSGRTGHDSQCLYCSPNGFSLPPRVVGPPVSTSSPHLSLVDQ